MTVNKTALRQAVKFNAKVTLSQNIGACIAVTAIVGGLSMLAASVSALFGLPMEEFIDNRDIYAVLPLFLRGQLMTILFGLIIAPVTVGSYSFFMRLARQKNAKILDVFSWFGEGRLMIKAICASAWYVLISVLWMAVSMCIPLAVIFVSSLSGISDNLSIVLAFLGMILMFAGAILGEMKVYTYLPAMYILAENPDISVFEAFRYCTKVMRGHGWEFFVLQFSFILWHLLAGVTCGISELYVMPYVGLSVCYFTNHVVSIYESGNKQYIDDSSQQDKQ